MRPVAGTALALAVLFMAQTAFAAYEEIKPSDKDYKPSNKAPLDKTKVVAPPTSGAPYPLSSPSYSTPGPANGYASFPAMQCTGHSYCFPKGFAAGIADPVCSSGYKLDKSAKKCYQYQKVTCPKDAYPSKAKDVCLECKPGQRLTTDSFCVTPCAKGASAVNAGGKKYCVEDCKAGFYSYGDACFSYTDYYLPKACDAKAKCKPGYTLVGGAVSDAYSAAYDKKAYADEEYGGAYKAYDNSHKEVVGKEYEEYADEYAKATVQCKCVKTDKRSAKKMAVADPKKVAAKIDMLWSDARCADGSVPDKKTFKCAAPCPKGSAASSEKGVCEYACPTGYKACSYFGETICTTKHNLFGADSCKVLSQLREHMDEEILCPIYNTKPAPKPSPAPAPKSG